MTHRPITVTVGPARSAFTDPTDPRPKHAAALVDPEPVPDASPWKDDGPDKDDVAAYVAKNLSRRAADDDQAGQNTRRAACALSVVLDYGSKYVGDDVIGAILGDLLADLRHAADALGLDYTDLDATADRRYTEEAVHGEPWGEL